jgi:hypothetical protein
MKLNNKGMFVTLTVFFLAGLMISANTNLNFASTINNDAELIALAGQRTTFIKQNFIDVLDDVFENTSIIQEKFDSNFVYIETLPNPITKTQTNINFNEARAFMYKEFSDNNFNVGNFEIDIFSIEEKGLTINHDGSSQSQNTKINFDTSTRTFDFIQFDINVDSASFSEISTTYGVCASCSEPVVLKINIWDSTETLAYQYENTIDYDQDSSAIFETVNLANDLIFDYDEQEKVFSWQETLTETKIKTTIGFFDNNYSLKTYKNFFEVNEMQQFGFVG